MSSYYLGVRALPSRILGWTGNGPFFLIKNSVKCKCNILNLISYMIRFYEIAYPTTRVFACNVIALY